MIHKKIEKVERLNPSQDLASGSNVNRLCAAHIVQVVEDD
jgi:hypothetical protein